MGMFAGGFTNGNAGKITLQLTSQDKTENGKTLCRYENSIYDKSITITGKHRPSTRTSILSKIGEVFPIVIQIEIQSVTQNNLSAVDA
jgi:hypothetical protein